jgi:hypothetical protein
VIYSHNNWYIKRGQARIAPGTPLSINTVAGGLLKDKNRNISSEEVDIDSWCDRNSLQESKVFIEESRYFERYNQVITLLRLP